MASTKEDSEAKAADTSGADKDGRSASQALPAAPTSKAANNEGNGAKNEGQGRKTRKLSSKPQDFQVRVKVIQARQLQGANIHPITMVTMGSQTQQTRVQKSTNSPYWDQAFFFNFNMSPDDLFDNFFHFQVFNSKRFISDALIGSFKCDVGLVYEEPQHALLNKWLLLGDPEDTMAGAKGYLKVSIVILGAGDEAPNMKVTDQMEDEDIESNLLRTAGVQLRPATFVLKVYRAEDIPRMDSAFLDSMKKVFGLADEGVKKELVDPYFKFFFAGTEVRSKTVIESAHPEWNEELRIGLQFPSMCERMKFTIKDWDRVSQDDTIGVYFLSLSHISSAGDTGYLPTFGPCFVNFYGSTREFSDLSSEYEDLNEGKGEGVAYRGRALVELVTTLGETPETPVGDIDTEDLTRIQKYMRRRKFRVHAAFLSATMIMASDALVEFEVSIGNYGNKLDENVAPSCSTTQASNTVFDGNRYYFLPWGSTKPSVVVDCSFEDISWRLEALNLFNSIAHELEANIERMYIAVKAKLPTPELAQLLISFLDQLIADCSKELPEPQQGIHVHTELDLLMAKDRQAQLDTIISMARTLRCTATDIQEAISEMEGYLATLNRMAIEPQNSMPDVVIWMLRNQKRIAYYRIPASRIFFCPDPTYCGRDCGKLQTIQLKMPRTKERTKDYHIPALLRVKLWLGLQNEEEEWHKMQTEGELAVFAETYENQVRSILGSWTNKGPTMTRHKWSDSEGKIKLVRDRFNVPEGWKWDGDWYNSPELSLMYDKDAGHLVFMEDVFECQSRSLPGAAWDEADTPWADVKGVERSSLVDIDVPEGWEWVDDWQIDLNRAVDEEGFEYCVDSKVGGYGPVERNFCLCRRRRWVRSRRHVARIVIHEAKKDKMAEGWQYAPLFTMQFSAEEHATDLVRRRRWHRKMVATDETAAACFFSFTEMQQPPPKIASVLDSITSKEKKKSRWRRDKKPAMTANLALTAPKMFLSFKDPTKYQLRAYIYQAMDLLAADTTGLSDPFAQVSFLTQSASTERVDKTLCPTWDQTLIFAEIEIHGLPRNLQKDPPDVYIELFDHDAFGKAEFLGRTKAKPMVKLKPTDRRTPVLEWYDIKRADKPGGSLLAAFELFQLTGKDLPFLPPKRDTVFEVPSGVRPVVQRTGIEVMCWGVRNMKKYHLSNVTSPSIQFECGGHLQTTSVIKDTKKNPNFDNPLLFFDVMIAQEELYMPSMNITVHDHRNFGRRPTVGVHILKSMEKFRCNPLEGPQKLDIRAHPDAGDNAQSPTTDVVIEIPEENKNEKSPWQSLVESLLGDLDFLQFEVLGYTIDLREWLLLQSTDQLDVTKQKACIKASTTISMEDIDWWSKFHASSGDADKCRKYLQLGYYKIKVYPGELEKAEEHKDFADFCYTFALTRGKEEDDGERGGNVVGEFKGTLRVYPLPPDPSEPLPPRVLSDLPSSAPELCIVRVYVVSCVDLQPSDPNGLADPYIEVFLGKTKKHNKSNYIPNCLNPVFGSWFELTASIPVHKDLTVRVNDYDFLSSDDLIGETVVDLENRYLTKWRATCGIPPHYYISGVNMWRDSKRPKEILEDYCRKNCFAAPTYLSSTSLQLGQQTFNLSDYEKNNNVSEELGPPEERLALHVLNCLPVVKEHVEKRPLYNTLQPGIEQGKILMWVDIFPKSLGPPGPPFDISPRKAKKFMVRCIIWNTDDVILEDESITGEKMSDIYVVGWMSGVDEKQQTDVHYRSLDGTGNFNWRFVFSFDYLLAEQTMVIKQKEHLWSLDETEVHTAPILIIQIWDNDKFSADDFLGTVELDLNKLPMPAKKASTCSLDMLQGNKVETGSIFEMKRIKGFWPCYNNETGDRELTGKVEMELELLTAEEAESAPAGLGREEPNTNPKLDPPKRPETSFPWFSSPFKTLQFIIWRNYKGVIITGLICTFFGLLFVLFIYSFPAELARMLMSRFSNPTPHVAEEQKVKVHVGKHRARHAVDDMLRRHQRSTWNVLDEWVYPER